MPLPASATSREKILDVAETLFARRGYAGVGLREVADGVGLGKSSLFHHFATKHQLYCEVIDRALERIRERLDPIARGPGPAGDRLARWVEALVDALAEQPTTARLLVRELVDDAASFEEASADAQRAERTVAGILAGIHGLLAEGVERGELHPVSIPQTVQTLIGATVYHFASGEFGDSLLGHPLLSAEAVARRKQELVGMLRRGLIVA